MQKAYKDVDQLEQVVHILAYGDIEAEDTCQLTETNFKQIFQLAQLTIEYLLHVQDVLNSEKLHVLESECAAPRSLVCSRPASAVLHPVTAGQRPHGVCASPSSLQGRAVQMRLTRL